MGLFREYAGAGPFAGRRHRFAIRTFFSHGLTHLVFLALLIAVALNATIVCRNFFENR